jgi:hypothetical protein
LDTYFAVEFNGIGRRHEEVSWRILASQNASVVPEAGAATNPDRLERSGIATVVDPFR